MLTNANCYAMMYLMVGKCQQKETEVRRIKARGTIKFYDLYLRIFEKGYKFDENDVVWNIKVSWELAVPQNALK